MATVKIVGMSCNHCAMAVRKALEAVPGIQNLEVKIGEARFDGDVNLDAVKAAIEEEGYEVVEVAK